MISKDREYRAFEFQVEEMRIDGVPIVYEQPTIMAEIDGIKYYEIISRGACDEETQMDNVVLVENHQGRAAAKTKNKTLSLRTSDDGLFISADLSKNATGRELHEAIKNGFYDKMSFAFTVQKDSYDKNTRTRRIEKIDRLYDVSVVDWPAYNQTSVSARSFFEAEAEKEMKERAEAHRREELLSELKRKVGINGN